MKGIIRNQFQTQTRGKYNFISLDDTAMIMYMYLNEHEAKIL